MKRIVVSILLLSALTSPLPLARGQSVRDLNSLKNTTAKRTTHYERFLAREISNDLTPNVYHARVDVPTSQRPDFDRFARIMVRDYERRKLEADIGMRVLGFNNDLVKGAFALGVAAAPLTGGASLAVAGAGYVASQALDEMLDAAKSAARSSYRNNLKTALEDFRRRATAEERTQLRATRDPERFKQLLESRVGPILGNALDGIAAEDQDIVNNFGNKVLAETLRDGLASLADAQALHGNEIAENRKNIAGLARAFVRFAEDNQKQLNDLRITQDEIKEGLNSLSKDITETKQGVAFLQQYMFGKMSPSEQLAALGSGAFPDIQGQQREKLRELVEKRRLLNEEIPRYLNGAQQVLDLAQQFGVSGPFLRTAQNIVNVGGAALNAVTALSSGNLLGAVSAVAGIFGLGGRDIAAERHQEIMKTLGVIYESIGVMHEKLDSLIRGQQTILRAQQETFNAIVEVSKQIQANHEQVMLELHHIHGDVLFNRELILSQVNSAYSDCRDHIFDLERDAGGTQVRVRVLDTGRGIYPSLQKIAELRRDNPGAFTRCNARLRLTREGDDRFNLAFLLETFKTINRVGQVDSYIDNVYKKALTILNRDLPFDITGEGDRRRITTTTVQRISSLLSPMADIGSLNRKLMNEVPDASQPRFILPLTELMQAPLSPEAVSVHAEHVLDIHFYYPILKGDDFIVSTRNELLMENNVSKAGEKLLTEALNLVDIAVAQETLVSGDYMLPLLREILKTPPTPASASTPTPSADALSLINTNTVLAENYVLYCVSQGIKENNSSVLGYAAGLASPGDPTILNRVTQVPSGTFEFNSTEEKRDVDGDGVQKVTKPVGWFVKIGEKSYPLPSAKELQEGRFTYTPELIRLLQLRSRLIDELNSYSILDRMSVGQRRRFNQLLLNSL